MNNEIRIKLGEQERILLNREILSMELMTNDGKVLMFKKIIVPDKDDRHLFGIYLYDGKRFLLYKHIKKVFKKANFQDKGVTTVGDNFDSFFEKTTFYIMREMNKPEKISLKKDEIISKARLSKPNEVETETFCKTKKISGKLTEIEAITLIEFIDSLEK